MISMESPSISTRDLARRLLAASLTVSDNEVHGAVLVSDKLRISLIRFAGVDGFTSLQRRALVLARAEEPSLHCVKVSADGRLQGFEEVPVAALAGAGTTITTHLLELLVTFIGESLMRTLIREAWLDTSLDIAFNHGVSKVE